MPVNMYIISNRSTHSTTSMPPQRRNVVERLGALVARDRPRFVANGFVDFPQVRVLHHVVRELVKVVKRP